MSSREKRVIVTIIIDNGLTSLVLSAAILLWHVFRLDRPEQGARVYVAMSPMISDDRLYYTDSMRNSTTREFSARAL